MGTRGLEVVRFHRRYYTRYHHYDSYFEGLGVRIIKDIPRYPEGYESILILLS